MEKIAAGNIEPFGEWSQRLDNSLKAAVLGPGDLGGVAEHGAVGTTVGQATSLEFAREGGGIVKGQTRSSTSSIITLTYCLIVRCRITKSATPPPPLPGGGKKGTYR